MNALPLAKIDQPGFRSKKYTVATTVVDTQTFTRSWIASVYRSRWLIELDICSIKCSLDMDVVRAKTPAMVKTEIWPCLLAYNLVRFKMLQSAVSCRRMPRSLSFFRYTTIVGFDLVVGVHDKHTVADSIIVRNISEPDSRQSPRSSRTEGQQKKDKDDWVVEETKVNRTDGANQFNRVKHDLNLGSAIRTRHLFLVHL